MAQRRSREQEALERIEEAARTGATELGLSDLGLTTLPDSLAQLQSLQTLYVHNNQLTALPDSLAQLRNLQVLTAYGNQLKELPGSLAQLQNLQELSVQSNKLTTLPDSLAQLENLRVLYIFNNEFAALPDSVTQLQNLQSLDVHNNHLTALPDSVAQLKNLKTLSVSDNHLATLPDSLGQLENLRQLWVHTNQLTALPHSLGQLENLRTLELYGNPLPDPYPELIKRGASAILTYFRSLAEEEETERQYEAKLILVGEGSVGKTCLVRALQAKPGHEKKAFDPKSKTTHGIRIGQVLLPHPDKPRTSMTLNAWDFGGQEVYRITHQFFFSRRALYLLVWRPREGQEAGQLEFWLTSIRLRAPDAKVILVSTYADEGRREVVLASVLKDYGDMIVGRHIVSNKKGEGFEELRQTIALHASHLPQMGKPFNKRWLAARSELLNKNRPHITQGTFAGVARKNHLAKDEASVLLDLLHDIGRIVYYSGYEGLRDTIVIKPEWLTRAISFVLEDELTADQGGMLQHSRVGTIWQDPNRPRGHRYPARHHPFFLRLMEKFDISSIGFPAKTPA